MKQLLFSAEPSPAVQSTGWLIVRVFAGLSLAFGHGMGKLPPGEKFVTDIVGGMGFPAPALFAWAAGLAEFAGGILLAAGCLTRVAALFVAFTMGTAAFVFHAGDPFSNKELAFVYLAIAMTFLIAGAGRWSIDAIFSGEKSQNQPSSK